MLKVNSEPFSVAWRRSGSLLECDVNASRERTNDGEKEIRSCKGGDLRYHAIRRSLTNRAAFIAASTCNLNVEVRLNAKTFQLPFRYCKIRGKSFINSTYTQICIAYGTYEGGEKRYVRGTLRLSSNNKYNKSNDAGYTAEEFLSEFITIFLLQSLLRRLERITFSSRRGLFVDRFVVVSGFAEEPRLWKEAVISLTVTRLKEESQNERVRRRETDVRMERRGYEGIQFPSSRGWRAAHTLPFGAVTPRELWSPNEWLGRAKRRITYFFFFFSRSCTLFQDVYKYENRTCLPTESLTTRRRPRSR